MPSPGWPPAPPSARAGRSTIVGDAGIGKTAVVDEAAAIIARRPARLPHRPPGRRRGRGRAGLVGPGRAARRHPRRARPPGTGAGVGGAGGARHRGRRPTRRAVRHRPRHARPARRRRRGRPDRHHRRRPPVGRPADTADAVVHRPTAAVRTARHRVDAAGRQRHAHRHRARSSTSTRSPTTWPTRSSRDAGVSAVNVRRELIAAGGGHPAGARRGGQPARRRPARRARPSCPTRCRSGRRASASSTSLLERLDQPVLDALLVAAAEPDGDLVRILTALQERGLGVAELEVAEENGVVMLDGDRLTFRHPLMRSAAYHDAPRADRRAAHRALAGTLPKGSPARAWHLARAAVGPDEEVAQELEEAAAADQPARRARRRPPARGSWPAGCRPTRPTGCAACGSPRWPSSTPAWRRRPAACSTAPTPSCPSTPAPTTSSSGSAASSCAAACHRPAADRTTRCGRCGGPRWRSPARAPDVAVDLLFDALAAYIRDGAFADMVERRRGVPRPARPRGRVAGPAHRHHGRRACASPAAARVARSCSIATPR